MHSRTRNKFEGTTTDAHYMISSACVLDKTCTLWWAWITRKRTSHRIVLRILHSSRSATSFGSAAGAKNQWFPFWRKNSRKWWKVSKQKKRKMSRVISLIFISMALRILQRLLHISLHSHTLTKKYSIRKSTQEAVRANIWRRVLENSKKLRKWLMNYRAKLMSKSRNSLKSKQKLTKHWCRSVRLCKTLRSVKLSVNKSSNSFNLKNRRSKMREWKLLRSSGKSSQWSKQLRSLSTVLIKVI